MISSRAAAFPAFSNANPKYSVRKAASAGVIDVIAPSANPTSLGAVQSRALTPLPISVGSPIVQLAHAAFEVRADPGLGRRAR